MEREERNRRRLQWAAAAVLILSPLLLLCLRSVQIRMNCFRFHPIWSDEMVYWREVTNFLAAGIHGGYTGVDDTPPRLANFGTHSFFNTLVYAGFARLFGWRDNSILLYNLLFLTLCLAVFVWVVRPGAGRLCLLAAGTVCYLPLYYYLPTSMTEALGYGLALLYLAALLRYARGRTRGWFFLTLLATALLCFFKLPNMAFFLPLLLVSWDGRKKRRFAVRAVLCALTAGAVYAVNTAFTSPYPWFFSDVFAQESVGRMIAKVAKRFAENLAHFVSFHYGTGQERCQRYFYLLLLAVFFVLTVREARACVRRGRAAAPERAEAREQAATQDEAAVQDDADIQDRAEAQEQAGAQDSAAADVPAAAWFLLLLSQWALVVALYEVWDWRDYRMLAPTAWIALTALLLRRPPRVFLLPALSALALFAGEWLRPSAVFSGEGRTQPIETPQAAAWIAYDAQAQDGFDNTLAVETIDLGLYMRLPPGIGIQNMFTPQAICRSRYVLAQETDYAFPGYHIVAEGAFGRLYERDAEGSR